MGKNVRKVKRGRIKEAFDTLSKDIRYKNDSKKGKYSIDTYLDMISDYADRIIRDEKSEGHHFQNGKCTVVPSSDFMEITFNVELFFKDKTSKEWSVTEFSSTKMMEQFVRETSELFADESVVIYEIEEPEDM